MVLKISGDQFVSGGNSSAVSEKKRKEKFLKYERVAYAQRTHRLSAKINSDNGMIAQLTRVPNKMLRLHTALVNFLK